MPPFENLTFQPYTTGNITYDAVPLNFTTDGTVPRTYATANGFDFNVAYDPTVKQSDLNEFAKKIYKIITAHTHLDITEDEFMKIIKE